MQYYKITWTDCFSESTWKDRKEIEEWAKENFNKQCTTIGYITYEDKNLIVVSASSNAREDYGEHMAILKPNIIKRVKVKA